MSLNPTNVPPGWAAPHSDDNDGIYWKETRPCTMSDYLHLKDVMGDSTKVDMRTVCGTYNKRWTTYWNQKNPDAVPSGGEGSTVYELQHVGEAGNGVQFSKKAIWHYNADGDYVKELPGNAGEYHKAPQNSSYQDAFVGPEPGSKAALMLGTGEYYWDDVRKLYDIKL